MLQKGPIVNRCLTFMQRGKNWYLIKSVLSEFNWQGLIFYWDFMHKRMNETETLYGILANGFETPDVMKKSPQPTPSQYW